MLYGGIVDHIATLEIVGGVEDERDIGHEGFDVLWRNVGDVSLDAHGGIDLPQLRYGSFGLRESCRDVVFVEEDLPLEIIEFEDITVYDADKADTGSNQSAR